MLGPLTNPRNEKLADASVRESLVLIPVAALIFVFGLYPAPLLGRMDATVKRYLDQFLSRLYSHSIFMWVESLRRAVARSGN